MRAGLLWGLGVIVLVLVTSPRSGSVPPSADRRFLVALSTGLLAGLSVGVTQFLGLTRAQLRGRPVSSLSRWQRLAMGLLLPWFASTAGTLASVNRGEFQLLPIFAGICLVTSILVGLCIVREARDMRLRG